MNQAAGGRSPNSAAMARLLEQCDQEPIHLANAIQPHGAMLVLAESRLEILQASAQAELFFGMTGMHPVGRTLAEFLGEAVAVAIRDALVAKSPEGVLAHLGNLAVPGRTDPCNVFGNRIDGLLILEWEPAALDFDFGGGIREAMQELHRTASLNEFLAVAVERVRDLSGFERVMAYRFADDGSGQVVAEARDPDLQSYLGHHFPASDIPEPARRLFALSGLRHLPDADYTPAPLLPEQPAGLGRPVDLSHSLLRSVSPIYREYLRNMGARATLVMPMIRDGRLWGLISCIHHRSPRFLPYERRLPLEILGRLIALQIPDRERLDQLDYRNRLERSAAGLLAAVRGQTGLHQALAFGTPNLLTVLDAGGAALVAEGRVSRLGAAPSEAACRLLADWLAERDEPVYASEAAGRDCPALAEWGAVASGILALRLAREEPEWVVWFRPEVPAEIHWAGDPAQPAELDGEGPDARLRPRASFALWKETVRGRSRPWLSSELEYAAWLRQGLLDILVERARRLERRNRELERSNRELESLVSAASHDLREPLRSVHNFAELLQIEEAPRVSERGRQRIEILLRQCGRMERLLLALLAYARAGSREPERRDLSPAVVVEQVLTELRDVLPGLPLSVEVQEPMPVVSCDRAAVAEILRNLIRNAVQYSDPPDQRVIVGCHAEAVPPVFFVQDEGIGIDPAHHERIFQLFRRLHGPAEYGGGTGAGLAIARRAVERHGGRIWVDSWPGAGATFFFTLAPEGDSREALP